MYPNVIGQDHSHLSKLGYGVLGAALGSAAANIHFNSEVKPIMISRVSHISNGIDVDFSGVRGSLLNDTALFSASGYNEPPANLGFKIFDTRGFIGRNIPKILESHIIDRDTVRLILDKAIVSDVKLYVGRSDGSWGSSVADRDIGGTSLRDSVSESWNYVDYLGIPRTEEIYSFLPIQSWDIMM